MFRVHPEPRRANPTRFLYPVYAELRSERTRRALRALCVLCVKTHLRPRPDSGVGVHPQPLGAFTSPALSAVEGSPACPEQSRRVDRTSLCPSPNSHRITSFALPHPLTPIESHLCKKQGGGVPLTPSRARRASCLCATRRNANNSNIFMGLLHNSRTPRGGGLLSKKRAPMFLTASTEHDSRNSGRYSLPTTHSQLLKPLLQMAHPYTCTCKKGPAAREPRYQPCAAS
jgi:hypothetical protein